MFTPSTIPGQMAILSFDRIVAPLAKGACRFVVTSCSLPWSQERRLWLDAALSQETLLVHLEDAFRSFGGAPRQLATHAKRPLSKATADDGCPWSNLFMRFCAHFGCEPVAIPRSSQVNPHAQEHLEEVLRRHQWQSLMELEQALQQQLGPVGAEAGHLLFLPNRPFVNAKETFCKVASDSFISLAGDSYSVPQSYTGRSVWVRRVGGCVVIRSPDGTCLATHPAGAGHGTIYLNPRHFSQIAWREQRDLERLKTSFLAVFPHHSPFLERLVAQRRLGAQATLRSLLALIPRHNTKLIEQAFEACHRYNNYSHRFIEGFMDKPKRHDDRSPEQPSFIQGELF